MKYKETRLYKLVSAYDDETDTYVIPDGAILYIDEVGGDACFNNEVKVEIKFDTDIILCTHGSTKQRFTTILEGNGTKELTIKLINDSSSSETIGGFYKGRLDD